VHTLQVQILTSVYRQTHSSGGSNIEATYNLVIEFDNANNHSGGSNNVVTYNLVIEIDNATGHSEGSNIGTSCQVKSINQKRRNRKLQVKELKFKDKQFDG